jgi:hypothetical protein
VKVGGSVIPGKRVPSRGLKMAAIRARVMDGSPHHRGIVSLVFHDVFPEQLFWQEQLAVRCLFFICREMPASGILSSPGSSGFNKNGLRDRSVKN